MIKFMDTCSLLELQQDAFKSKFYISSITLTELENIKTSAFKDEELKWRARRLLHLLEQNQDKYEVIIYRDIFDTILEEYRLPSSNDSRIIATAVHLIEITNDDLIFITNDLACKMLASSIGMKTEFVTTEEEDYCGYQEIKMDNTELANFYGDILVNNKNIYDLKQNEYILIKDDSNKIIDKYKWLKKSYHKIPFIKLNSKMFGKITPKDIYQQIALDSLASNQITMLRGKPGSGKSFLALGYLMNLLEQGAIDRIVIFANTVAVRGAAKLGFYPGDKNSKLLDSQIGNFLASKFGSIIEVEKMIDDGFLILLPIADCRGTDLSGMNAGVLFTEAQNTSIDIMKLVLQRIGEDSICIFEGDDKSQVDMREYYGDNNGLKRLSKVFRNNDIYGEVTLKNIHRSKIAEIADKM